MNYYNEFDPGAAAWLRELIAEGLIPAGKVDERSIEDVKPSELMGYTQCHFFAGIGGWSQALRLAGVPDTLPVWTGSCPCQPFSSAGKGAGVDDPRHLWPVFHWLIGQCQPATVFGEQVASKAGRGWFSGVRADLEALGYAVGAADLCAASVGASHIRQRLFWVGDAEGNDQRGLPKSAMYGEGVKVGGPGSFGGVGNSDSTGRVKGRIAPEAAGYRGAFEPASVFSGLADSELPKRRAEYRACVRMEGEHPVQFGRQKDTTGHPGHSEDGGLQHPQSHGRNARGTESDGWGVTGRCSTSRGGDIWIPCADGKSRRIKPGTLPLVNGIPRGVVPSIDPRAPGYAENTGEARAMRLRGYGNAIHPELAAEFIAAFFSRGD